MVYHLSRPNKLFLFFLFILCNSVHAGTFKNSQLSQKSEPTGAMQHERSFRARFEERHGNIVLEWAVPARDKNLNFIIEYECSDYFCSTLTKEIITTNATRLEITSLPNVSKCEFELFDGQHDMEGPLATTGLTIPETTKDIRFFEASFDENHGSILLEWDLPEDEMNSKYIIEYECPNSFCRTTTSNILITNATRLEITNLPHFSRCGFKLYGGKRDDAGLIALTSLGMPETMKDIDMLEMPKTVSLLGESIHIELESCENFRGSLQYSIYSKLTDSDEEDRLIYSLDTYSSGIDINLLKATSEIVTYNIIITAQRPMHPAQQKFFFYVPALPENYLSIENCSAYSRNNNTISIQCSVPADSSNIDMYKITIENRTSETINANETWKCEFSNNSICAKITGLADRETFNVVIQARSSDYKAWGVKNYFTLRAPTESDPPENLRVKFHQNESYFEISWEHPRYVYGRLEKFQIELNDLPTEHVGSLDQLSYSQKIPVPSCNDGTVRVYVKNGFPSKSTSDRVFCLHGNVGPGSSELHATQNAVTSEVEDSCVDNSNLYILLYILIAVIFVIVTVVIIFLRIVHVWRKSGKHCSLDDSSEIEKAEKRVLTSLRGTSHLEGAVGTVNV